jgi:predicted acylesterase/phospholipase RssA
VARCERLKIILCDGSKSYWHPRFVCAVRKDNDDTVLFRNYPRPSDANEGNESEDATILQTARATSAAPFYFPAAKVGDVKYFDGGLENNNPIDKVWVERAPI